MEHENQMPKLQVKYPATSSSTGKSSEVNPKPQSDEWFELLEQTSPIDMLASWSESEPTISQKAMVEELIEREKMSFGVINILLQFVMLKEDMKLPKAYILEIASNWKKKGVLRQLKKHIITLKKLINLKMRGLAEITKSVVHTMGSVIAFQKKNT